MLARTLSFSLEGNAITTVIKVGSRRCAQYRTKLGSRKSNNNNNNSNSQRSFSAASIPGQDLSELHSYLEKTAEIDVSLHDGVLKALQTMYGNHMTVANLKSFGLEGLRALAASVEQQEIKRGGTWGQKRPSRKVNFVIPHHHTSFELDWKKGDSLLDVAKENEQLLGEYIEGSCGGQMSCCTCHVYLNDATLQQMPPPARGEKDMLDLAFEPRDNSRLGCQVVLQRSLLEMEEPIIATIPSMVHNVWK